MPALTAPLTTLTTISTDITSAIKPNATRNGTHGGTLVVSCVLAVSQDCASATALGSARPTVAMSALTATLEPALANRYSICSVSGTPSAVIWAGTTQPPAVPVAEVPTPTTVSVGRPGTPVSVITWPRPRCRRT